MYALVVGLILLFAGYLTYSKIVERAFLPYRDPTPGMAINDGNDYVPMPTWKNHMIQLLNIAGTGPIFGALMGARWGPIVFLWIIFGTMLGGAVHDYVSGMMSVRNGGISTTGLVSKYIGGWCRVPIIALIVLLLVMVQATFARSASDLLVQITGLPLVFWIGLVLVYFLVSAVLPIDKVIGRIYPVFGILLITMAVVVIGGLLMGGYDLPGISFENLHPDGTEYYPDMLVTVACGAISGFHATQSPMVQRCLRHERNGRSVFYGAMVMEQVIALIWATAGLAFYGDTGGLAEALRDGGQATVVYDISVSVAGSVGGVLAVIGVIVCPITTGDTALRAARIILVDENRKLADHGKRAGMFVSLVLLAVIVLFCCMDFSLLWSYFAWINQCLACIILWTSTSYLLGINRRGYWLMTAIPAVFMTMTVTSYILGSPLGADLELWISLIIGAVLTALIVALFARFILLRRPRGGNTDASAGAVRHPPGISVPDASGTASVKIVL